MFQKGKVAIMKRELYWTWGERESLLEKGRKNARLTGGKSF